MKYFWALLLVVVAHATPCHCVETRRFTSSCMDFTKERGRGGAWFLKLISIDLGPLEETHTHTQNTAAAEWYRELTKLGIILMVVEFYCLSLASLSHYRCAVQFIQVNPIANSWLPTTTAAATAAAKPPAAPTKQGEYWVIAISHANCNVF